MVEETVYSLFADARNAVKNGDKENAERLYKRVIQEYPDSSEASVSARELKELKGEVLTPETGDEVTETDYATTVVIAKFVAFVGWVVVVLAALILVVSLAGAGRMGLLAIAPSIGLAVGGLLLVMSGQVTRAIVQNTQYTRRIAEILSERQTSQ